MRRLWVRIPSRPPNLDKAGILDSGLFLWSPGKVIHWITTSSYHPFSASQRYGGGLLIPPDPIRADRFLFCWRYNLLVCTVLNSRARRRSGSPSSRAVLGDS